ncbi:MAG: hypothetical protein MSC30_07660 [Gaiellaceae bacterium MAG52_C11]|nr:hypothetical protein [Candidatus Gaiellasilicea maunaloa]
MDPARASLRLERRIEWADTDASGHWHNTAALRFVEWAERILLDRLGLLEDSYGRMPRVHITVDFRLPLRFNELAEIVLEIIEVGRTSVTYRADISRGGEIAAQLCFVAVLRGDDGRPTAWAEETRRLLTTAGPQVPELLPSPTHDGPGTRRLPRP